MDPAMKTILLFAAGFVAYAVIKGLFLRERLRHSKRAASRDTEAKRDKGEEMMLDPVCGSYVPVGSSISEKIDGVNHYFCSTGCRDKYASGAR